MVHLVAVTEGASLQRENVRETTWTDEDEPVLARKKNLRVKTSEEKQDAKLVAALPP